MTAVHKPKSKSGWFRKPAPVVDAKIEMDDRSQWAAGAH
jgi:hypothetical protein